MILEADENGKKKCTCDGRHWFLMYVDGKVTFADTHCGTVEAGKNFTVEYFDSEADMQDRITELGLTPLPPKDD